VKPANLVHVAGFCISCGIVAYYLTRPASAPVYYEPPPRGQALIEELSGQYFLSSLKDDSPERIWNAALFYDRKGMRGEALGCFERLLALYPDDANAARARERVAVLRDSAPAASP
jgi:tetratricopeptide (TPR) repeat protein